MPPLEPRVGVQGADMQSVSVDGVTLLLATASPTGAVSRTYKLKVNARLAQRVGPAAGGGGRRAAAAAAINKKENRYLKAGPSSRHVARAQPTSVCTCTYDARVHVGTQQAADAADAAARSIRAKP